MSCLAELSAPQAQGRRSGLAWLLWPDTNQVRNFQMRRFSMLRKMLSLLILLPCIILISSGFLRAQTIYHPEKLGPQDYNFTTVDSPGLYQEVDNGNFVTWVNNSGLVSQQYVGIDGNFHTAVLLEDGWEVIDVPGATNTEGTNANSQGQIALTYSGADGVAHLAIWKEGRYSYVNDPCPAEYTYGVAVGINDLGQVTSYVIDSNGVGWACVGNIGKHPNFPYRSAVFGFPGAVGTVPIMTNDLGVTVGAYWDAQGVQHGFVHRMIGNVFTSVDFPGASNSWVQGIDDEGIMNGSAQLNANGDWAGFEIIGGHIEDWNMPDAVQTDLFVITNNLRVAGLYQSADGVWHGFVATPR